MPAQPVTIYHNPRCSSSVHALATARELGVDVHVVEYLKHPPSAAELVAIAERFEGDVTDMVRRDATWARLGLADADVATAEQVADVLAEHPPLLQRPLLVTGATAAVGRPKPAVADMLRRLSGTP